MIIAIDPGKSGGIVWEHAGEIKARKMPETPQALFALFRELSAENNACAFIEQVPLWAGFAAWQGKMMSGASTAKMYGSYKLCEGILVGLQIPTTHLTPIKWQNIVGCRNIERLKGPEWKRKLKAHAESLFSSKIKVTLWNADALLILHAGRQIIKP
jgi:hypothetical protein